MSKTDLCVQTSCLKTRTKNNHKEIICGKIENELMPGSFLIYILEIDCSLGQSKLLRKFVQTLENSLRTSTESGCKLLEKVLTNSNHSIGRLSEAEDSPWVGKVNSIIALVEKNEIHFSYTGSIIGYIFRNNKISSLVERNGSKAEDPYKTFTDVTSGKISANDRLFFSNTSLFDSISLDRIRTLISADNINAGISSMVQYLKKQRVNDSNAIIISTGSEQIDEDCSYIDEPEENFISTAQKNLKPLLEKLLYYSSVIWQIIQKNSKNLYRTTKKKWHLYYAPKTKQMLNSSNQYLAKNLKNAQNSFFEQKEKISKLEKIGGLYIKKKSYSKNLKSNGLAEIINTIMYWLSQSKVLFNKQNRKYLITGVILIFVIFGYWKIQVNNSNRNAKLDELKIVNSLDQAIEKFNKNKEDLALGKTIEIQGLYDALSLAEKAKEAPNNLEKANTLIAEIKELIDEKTKTVRFTNSKSFNIANDVNKIVLSGSDIFGIAENGKIYLADSRDSESKLVGSLGAENGKTVDLHFSKSNSKIYIYTDKKKLFLFDPVDKTYSELKTANDTGWEDANSVSTYSTNVYLLGSDAGEVWKHVKNDSDYSKGSAYVDTKKINIQGATSISIDGNVYLLLNTGQVAKFVKGSLEQDFSLRGIPKPNDKIIIPAKLYTSEDTNNIFILDKELNRILKFDKSGDYQNQYVFDNTKITDFVVNPKLQKIWILANGKILEGDL